MFTAVRQRTPTPCSEHCNEVQVNLVQSYEQDWQPLPRLGGGVPVNLSGVVFFPRGTL